MCALLKIHTHFPTKQMSLLLWMVMCFSPVWNTNFLSLLCYLADLLMFGRSEEDSLQSMRMVFDRLKKHNLKTQPEVQLS